MYLYKKDRSGNFICEDCIDSWIMDPDILISEHELEEEVEDVCKYCFMEIEAKEIKDG